MRRIFERSSLIASAIVLVACSHESSSPEDLQLASDGGRADDAVRASDASPDLDADASMRVPGHDAANASLADADGAVTGARHDAAASAIARDAASVETSTPTDSSAGAPEPTGDVETPDPGSQPTAAPDASAPTDAGPPVVCDDALNYDSFGRAFMATYCTSCHGQKTEPPFTSLVKIEPYKAEIVERVLYEPIDALHMPPYGRPQPSVPERAELERWLVCGPK